MKLTILIISILSLNSCSSKDRASHFSDSDINKYQAQEPSINIDTLKSIGIDILVSNDTIVIKNTNISGEIINNIQLTPQVDGLIIRSETLDTVIRGTSFSYESTYAIELANGIEYSIINGILNCTNRFGEFKLLDYTWVPTSKKFNRIITDEVEVSKESIQFGSDFFTLFRVVSIKSSKQYDLDFLKSSFIAVDYSKKFKKGKNQNYICKNAVIELYSSEQKTVTAYDYHGLIVK
jgi:hypothetical protein